MSLSTREYVQINQALFSLTHAYETRMAAEVEDNPFDLNLSDCGVLMVMHQTAPTHAAELSRVMDINPGTISVYVQRLVEKQLVQREQDSEDRRNWWLTLTDRGQVVAQGVVEQAAAYTRDFLSALDEEEQATLRRLLLKASHSLGFNWQ
jgi:DNA-binding MarR family transcriptional regulator